MFVFAIFDFSCRTINQIMLELSGYVPCGLESQTKLFTRCQRCGSLTFKDLFSSCTSPKPSSRLTSNLVAMSLRWVSTRFVQTVMLHCFFLFLAQLTCQQLSLSYGPLSTVVRHPSPKIDIFSKTVIQIQDIGGNVPWVGLYQVCSNSRGPVIFGFLMNFFVLFF